MKKIAVIGCTGSVGTQTLDVVKKHPERFSIEALAAGSNIDLLLEQVHQFRPKMVSVGTKQLAEQISGMLPSGTKVFYGDEGLIQVAAHNDAELVITAIVGSVGLPATLAAISAGKNIGLANKETLVTAGHIVMELAREKNVAILPVDSEHSAIFQCLNGESLKEVAGITITASGGSFRDRTREQLEHVTVEDALKHPNWSMGAKITIDSATMVNKGLEVIEAHWLFGLPYEQIGVVLHPESIVHSFVEYRDSSIIAQLGTPDMRIPIQYALSYPERIPSKSSRLALTQVGALHFKEMDFERFPCLKMAYDCGKIGGTAPTVFNAANEIAVASFLNKEISFLQIEEIIEKMIAKHTVIHNPDLETIQNVDAQVRKLASSLLRD